MPWKESSMEDERLALMLAWDEGLVDVTTLCRQAGVTRKTGYKWRERYEAEGEAGLAERRSAPHTPRYAATEAQAERILAVRLELESRGGRRGHGPDKISAVLCRRFPDEFWPSASTIGRYLAAWGLTDPRPRHRRFLPAPPLALTVPQAPMEVVTIDVMGTFWTADRARCDTLTVLDLFTRRVLLAQLIPSLHGAVVQPLVDRVFQQWGLPQVIRSDNGSPFASRGCGGLTPLSLRWLQQGIALERIAPGRPTQNGAHEHFHRTLKAACCRPPAASRAAQQRAITTFLAFYNTERPHAARQHRPPDEGFVASPRPWRPPTATSYDAGVLTRRIKTNGYLPFRGTDYYLSETLAGQRVALYPSGIGAWDIAFGRWDLAVLDTLRGELRPHPQPVGPPRGGPEQTQLSPRS
jgi:putative transposase